MNTTATSMRRVSPILSTPHPLRQHNTMHTAKTCLPSTGASSLTSQEWDHIHSLLVCAAQPNHDLSQHLLDQLTAFLGTFPSLARSPPPPPIFLPQLRPPRWCDRGWIQPCPGLGRVCTTLGTSGPPPPLPRFLRQKDTAPASACSSVLTFERSFRPPSSRVCAQVCRHARHDTPTPTPPGQPRTGPLRAAPLRPDEPEQAQAAGSDGAVAAHLPAGFAAPGQPTHAHHRRWVHVRGTCHASGARTASSGSSSIERLYRSFCPSGHGPCFDHGPTHLPTQHGCFVQACLQP